MIQMQVVSGLLNTVANTAYPKSQQFATNTLLFLTERHPVVAKTLLESMGSNFFDLLQVSLKTVNLVHDFHFI